MNAIAQIGFSLLCVSVFPEDQQTKRPKEFGNVRWLRDLAAAKERAKTSGKPIFLFFQESPGCSTCVRFGQSPLSHPLLVEAIEDEFVPLGIYNNRSGGHDEEVLQRFGESAWNNPVVRFVDAEGKDLLPRKEGVYATHAIAARMAEALRAAKRPVPGYLELIAEEGAPESRRRATFAMT